MTTSTPKHTRTPAHITSHSHAGKAASVDLITTGTSVTLASVIDAAARKLGPRIASVPVQSLLPITVDIPATVLMMLGSAERISEYLPALRQLPFYDPTPAEEVTDLAYALFDAHQRTLLVPDDQGFQKQVQRATVLRARCIGTLDMLVQWDAFDAAAVADLRAGTGYRDLVSDVFNCVHYLRGLPTELRSRLLVTDAELDEALALAASLEHTLGAREEGTTMGHADPGVRRQQAFTMVVKAWDEIRRGLTFLRHTQGDADTIAPSLFAKGSARRSSTSDTPATPNGPAAPSAPATPSVSATNTVASSPIPPAKNGGPFTS